MKRLMEMIEEMMVAIAFAEEGIHHLTAQGFRDFQPRAGEKTWPVTQ